MDFIYTSQGLLYFHIEKFHHHIGEQTVIGNLLQVMLETTKNLKTLFHVAFSTVFYKIHHYFNEALSCNNDSWWPKISTYVDNWWVMIIFDHGLIKDNEMKMK